MNGRVFVDKPHFQQAPPFSRAPCEAPKPQPPGEQGQKPPSSYLRPNLMDAHRCADLRGARAGSLKTK